MMTHFFFGKKFRYEETDTGMRTTQILGKSWSINPTAHDHFLKFYFITFLSATKIGSREAFNLAIHRDSFLSHQTTSWTTPTTGPRGGASVSRNKFLAFLWTYLFCTIVLTLLRICIHFDHVFAVIEYKQFIALITRFLYNFDLTWLFFDSYITMFYDYTNFKLYTSFLI